jgi:hypothetical protein
MDSDSGSAAKRKRKRSSSPSPSVSVGRKGGKRKRSSYRKKTWKELGRTDARKGRKRKLKKTHVCRSAEYKKRKNTKRRAAWKHNVAKNKKTKQAIRKPRENLKPGARKKGCKDFSAWERTTVRDLRRKGNTMASLPGLLLQEAEKEGRGETRKRALSSCKAYANGKVRGKRRGAEPIPQIFKDALVHFSKRLRKQRENKGETPLSLPMAASGFPGSDSSAYRAMKSKKQAARPCRVKPPLTEVNREERMERCKEILEAIKSGEIDREFFQEELIYLDCKTFNVNTTARKKMLFRKGARRFVWRTRSEGLLPECTKPSQFAAKGGGRGLKIFAAIGGGRLILFEEYRKWNRHTAARLTKKLREECERIWPEKKQLVIHLCHDNDRSFNSAENALAEKNCLFELFPIPVRSPELMPLDYTHWKWILDRMREHEDRVGWRNRKESVKEYSDRLKRTAFSLNKFPEVVDRAHACMVDHAEMIVGAGGGHFEDGRKALKRWRDKRCLLEGLEGFKHKGKFPLWLRKGWREFFDEGPDEFLDHVSSADSPAEKKKRSHWTRSPRIAMARNQKKGGKKGEKNGGKKGEGDPSPGEQEDPPAEEGKGGAPPGGKAKDPPAGKKTGGAPLGGKGEEQGEPEKDEEGGGPERAVLPEGLVPSAPPPAERALGRQRVERNEVTQVPRTRVRLANGKYQYEYRGVVQVGLDGSVYRVQTEVERQGHVEEEAAGDGSCLFNSFSVFVEDQSPSALREAVAAGVRDLPAGTRLGRGERLGTFLRRALIPGDRAVPSDVRAELRREGGHDAAPLDALRRIYAGWLLRKDKRGRFCTWGSHFDIAVFAHLFKRQVFVHLPKGPRAARRYVEVGEPVGREGDPEVLLVYRGGCHYNFLLPEE